MKDNIISIIEMLEEIESNFDYSEIETAIYLYCRIGKEETENLSKEDIQDIYYKLLYYDGSLFNEEINDYLESNFAI